MNTKGLVYIIIGAILECCWAYGLKQSDSPLTWAFTISCVVASFIIFTKAFKYVGASMAYVLYTGLGTLFVVLVEMIDTLYHGGTIDIVRIILISTLMLGVIIVKSAKE